MEGLVTGDLRLPNLLWLLVRCSLWFSCFKLAWNNVCSSNKKKVPSLGYYSLFWGTKFSGRWVLSLSYLVSLHKKKKNLEKANTRKGQYLFQSLLASTYHLLSSTFSVRQSKQGPLSPSVSFLVFCFALFLIFQLQFTYNLT